MVYTACAVCVLAVRVTILRTGSEFRPVSNFTELHALTLAARSYALLPDAIDSSSTNEMTCLEALKETFQWWQTKTETS